MRYMIASLILFSTGSVFSQTLHPLEPPIDHYLELSQLSATPNPARAALDSIRFPASLYMAEALLYTLIQPRYLSREQIDLLKKSIAFPANSSDQTQAELAFLVAWQDKRSPVQERRAAEVLAPIGYWPHLGVMNDHEGYSKNLEHLFFEGREILGPQCTAKNYPATAKWLEGITTDMRIMEFSAKYHFLRARPYQLEPGLNPLARMSSPSFASGHTLWAYIQAFAWSELFPDKRHQFLELAYEIGESREIMGIHFPSDEEAARVLAHRMLESMWLNDDFQADLERARQEWK
jgi:acid phosphatase (class A)